MKRRTLFILFYFPPFPRVGGRRWAKYLKYLDLLGFYFKVLAGDFQSASPWDKDVISYKEKTQRIPVKIKYPYFKRILPGSILQKIPWKLSQFYWKGRELIYKGNLWDDSVGFENVFFKQVIQLVEKEKIERVVMSLGPFSIARILVPLKRKYPELEIVLDYRDYWNDNNDKLTSFKREAEINLEKNILKIIDKVLVVNKEMKDYFMERLGFDRLYVLPHCYDEDDFVNIRPIERKKNPETLKIVYGGSLYGNMENYVNQLIDFIIRLSSLGVQMEINIYSAQKGYDNLFKNSPVKIHVHGNLPLNDYLVVMNDSDIILFFRPDWSSNALSSKFFEIVRLNKPILYFGPQGEVSEFLIENELGLPYSVNWSDQELLSIISKIKNNTLVGKNYYIEQHSFEKSTLDLIKILNE